MKAVQLTEKEKAVIAKMLKTHPAVSSASIFGSRALGGARNGSDVDIALFGDVKPQDASSVRGQLNEETDLPYFFDVVVYNDIDNEKLREHIDTHGVRVYEAVE